MNTTAPCVTVAIPGTAFRALRGRPLLSGRVSGAAGLERIAVALSLAVSTQRGRFISYEIAADPAALGILWQECMVMISELPTGQLTVALGKVCQRINTALRDVGYTYPTINALPERREAAGPVRPVEETVRRNYATLPLNKGITGADYDMAVFGGPGEPTRTPEDMRVAIEDQMERYLQRFPAPFAVTEGMRKRAAALIVADHYSHPCHLYLTRSHLIRYLELPAVRR